jgi:hypothetical protein
MYTIDYETIRKGFPKTIKPPIELQKLVQWANENEHKMGGLFELYADEENKCLQYWANVDFLNDRFAQFGVGPSGAPTGIWLDDDGKTHIVYLHDEERWGDVVADNFVNYLRILAIGYDDVNASCDVNIQTYNQLCGRENLNTGHNPAFKAWVEKEFGTTVPATGDEVFIKERDKFNIWLDNTIKTHYLTHLNEYDLFEYIGQDIRQTSLLGRFFLSKEPRKVGKTRFTFPNYYGIKAIMNDDYTIRCIVLGGNDEKLRPYSGYNPAALESADTRATVEKLLGKPVKVGRKEKSEYYTYEIKSIFGIRQVQVFFNPDNAADNIWRIVIA